MAKDEKTSKTIASKAGRLAGDDIDKALGFVDLIEGLLPPIRETLIAAKSVAASALTQAPDRPNDTKSRESIK